MQLAQMRQKLNSDKSTLNSQAKLTPLQPSQTTGLMGAAKFPQSFGLLTKDGGGASSAPLPPNTGTTSQIQRGVALTLAKPRLSKYLGTDRHQEIGR